MTIALSKRDNLVRVSITDHGSRIPDEFRSPIFQKFAQADSSDTRQKGGTGLGLSISKAIIEKPDGRTGFESNPGTETTFYFELPQWQENAGLSLAMLQLPPAASDLNCITTS